LYLTGNKNHFNETDQIQTTFTSDYKYEIWNIMKSSHTILKKNTCKNNMK